MKAMVWNLDGLDVEKLNNPGRIKMLDKKTNNLLELILMVSMAKNCDTELKTATLNDVAPSDIIVITELKAISKKAGERANSMAENTLIHLTNEFNFLIKIATLETDFTYKYVPPYTSGALFGGFGEAIGIIYNSKKLSLVVPDGNTVGNGTYQYGCLKGDDNKYAKPRTPFCALFDTTSSYNNNNNITQIAIIGIHSPSITFGIKPLPYAKRLNKFPVIKTTGDNKVGGILLGDFNSSEITSKNTIGLPGGIEAYKFIQSDTYVSQLGTSESTKILPVVPDETPFVTLPYDYIFYTKNMLNGGTGKPSGCVNLLGANNASKADIDDFIENVSDHFPVFLNITKN